MRSGKAAQQWCHYVKPEDQGGRTGVLVIDEQLYGAFEGFEIKYVHYTTLLTKIHFLPSWNLRSV